MLIFDFDGILIDSVIEAGVSAYNTVTGRLATAVSELPPGCIESFVLNRFHFQPAGDILPLMRWCVETGAADPARVLSAAEYSDLIRSETIPLVERTAKFFATRNLFVAKDKTAWVNLNRPYRPLWDALVAAGGERVVILTNKNRQAVIDLTAHFGLTIRPENVYSGDGGATKAGNLQTLHRRFNAPHYLFIDDCIGNLREVREATEDAPFELRLGLGAWGYIGPNDRTEAPREGFPVFEQTDIVSLLPEELPR